MEVPKSNGANAPSTTPNQQPSNMPQQKPRPRFDGKPYLQCLQSLENSFPALKSFLRVIGDENDRERHIVESWYHQNRKRSPGRCFCLQFNDTSVTSVEKDGFQSPDALREYLKKNPAAESRAAGKRRLFILEDMDSNYVDALGPSFGCRSFDFQRADEYVEFYRFGVNSVSRSAIRVGASKGVYVALL